MSRINYHHLHYFWSVAKIGNLTLAAQQLHVSQSALSMQIKQLEDVINMRLFDRLGRTLVLTEAGRIIFGYANEIFSKGEELEAFIKQGQQSHYQLIRIGSTYTLSRNFLEAFVAPLLPRNNVSISLQSARLDDLLQRLEKHALDVVLSNISVQGNAQNRWRCQLIARQQVSVIGPMNIKHGKLFPQDFKQYRWLLPSQQSEIRGAFDSLCGQWQFEPDILAEVDDMAMLRLLARDSGALSVLPKVVVRDEISRGELEEYVVLPNVFENFYAITTKKDYQPSSLSELLQQQSDNLLSP
jgi:LysR family transcriptional activator of nhaA